METEKILLKHAIPVIKDLILDYAFKYNDRNDIFEMGYFELCSATLSNIYKLNLGEETSGLINDLFRRACKGGNMNLIKNMILYNNVNLSHGILGACEKWRCKIG